ncbi:hypothetical protein SROCM77S_06774 [Streptomyces rochei]
MVSVPQDVCRPQVCGLISAVPSTLSLSNLSETTRPRSFDGPCRHWFTAPMPSGAGIVVLRLSDFEHAKQGRRNDARASSNAKHAAREPPPANQLVPLRSRKSKRPSGVLHAPCPVPCGTNTRGTVLGARRLALLCVHRLLSSRRVAFCAGYAVRRPRVRGEPQLSAELPVWLTGVSLLCSLGLDPAAADPKALCALAGGVLLVGEKAAPTCRPLLSVSRLYQTPRLASSCGNAAVHACSVRGRVVCPGA